MNKEGGSLGGMPSLDEFPNVYARPVEESNRLVSNF